MFQSTLIFVSDSILFLTLFPDERVVVLCYGGKAKLNGSN